MRFASFRRTLAPTLVALVLSLGNSAAAASDFTVFETGQVRPLALSPDGTRLFAVNTPDNRLEIFDAAVGGLTKVGSVPVGLEPIAVAARTNGEVWVVNHLSDSISIVDVTTSATAHVVRTLLVGDEPRDIVFGGTARDRAFITTAHRGQNTPLHPTIETILITEGIGRADVWVFDANALGATLGGSPLTILTLFTDTPRALAVSADGSRVYAAGFHSGNRTTTLGEGVVPDGGLANNGLPPPDTNFQGITRPEVGLIVKFDGTHWRDETGERWTNRVRLELPDEDVFAIDANATPPIALAGPGNVYSGVGTILFNMIANPVSGKVYVANLESFNHIRFEGPGIYAASFKPPGVPASVRGHLAESRITVLDGASVLPRHLNKHIDYATCCAAIPNAENDTSLAFPLDMAISSDGATLYVAGFGSSEVGVYDTAALEADTFTPDANDQLSVSGGGPTGLVLDEARSQLYVLTRFDNSISILNTGTGAEAAHVALHNPEPANVVAGRPFLYDATETSSHGDSACASCHIFGDFDSLAWDLGNPDETMVTNPNPFVAGAGPFIDPDFHPMKGPMTTQSLRGMANHGPMHWRGDRTGGVGPAPGGSVQPNRGAFNEEQAFKAFNPAFEGLIGRNVELTEHEMQQFTDFILQVTYPPNPIRNLDNSLTPQQQAGKDHFFGPISDTLQNCNGCHTTNVGGNPGDAAPGFFGSDGRSTFEGETQTMKVAHLRNVYQKVGMFGMRQSVGINDGNNDNTGPQVRGFGFLHDGSIDTVLRFYSGVVFNLSGLNPGGFAIGAPGDALRRESEAFMMAFDSNLAPIVGQQMTRTSTNGGVVDPRLDLLRQRADAGECDLIAKAIVNGESRGAYYVGGGQFVTDRGGDGQISESALRAWASAPGQELTVTCVPPGSGVRIGIDRDRDSFGDRDELDASTDPTNGASTPAGAFAVCRTVSPVEFRSATITDERGRLSVRVELPLGTYTQETVSVLAEDGGGAIVAGNVPGASIVRKGKSYKFSPPGASSGITRVQLREKKNSGGLFTLTLKTKKAWTPPRADEDEPTTEVTVNVGGTCFHGTATRVR